VVHAAEAALRALDFRHGLAHTEIMLKADGPRIIEVNARSGGALPYLFGLASDLDPVVEAGRLSLGLGPTGEVRFDGHALFVGPQHPVGVTVKGVTGLDRVRGLTGVRHVIPLSVGGASTARFQDTLMAAVLAVAPTPDAAVRIWRDVMDLVQPEYESTFVRDLYRRAPGSTGSPGGGLVDEGVVERDLLASSPVAKEPEAAWRPPPGRRGHRPTPSQHAAPWPRAERPPMSPRAR